MKIKMLTRIAGSRNGVRWPDAGGAVDLPDGEARDLVAAGLAEPAKVDEPKVAQPEKAVAPKATTRKR